MEFNELVQAVRNYPVNIVNKINDDNVPGWGNTEEYTVIHYTGVHAPKFAGIEGSPGRKGCGAKLSVDWDGNMYQHCSDGAMVWAVGTAGCYKQKHPVANNRNCESIELACKNDDPSKRKNAGPEWYIPEKTLIAGMALAAYTLKRKGQGVDHLLRHYDVVNKICPAPLVHREEDWNLFKKVVAAVMEDAPEPGNTIKVCSGCLGLVTTANLNIRTAPNTRTGAIIKTALKGISLYPVKRTLYPNIWFENADGWFSGKYVTGWILDQDSCRWWYLDNGQYAVGWRFINGQWYYFDVDGWMKTGWLKIVDVWYYLDQEGHMQTGWQKINGEWYFLDTDGHMIHDRWAYNTTNKNYYWLQSDGKWDGKTIQDPDQWESTKY